MIDRGLIERVPGPGRAVRHRLTARGESLREEATAIVRDVLAGSFSPLTPAELETLGDYLERLLA